MKEVKQIVILDGYTVDPFGEELPRFERYAATRSYPRTLQQEAAVRIGSADAVFTDETRLTAEVLSQCPDVKYIGLLATGTNNADLDYAREKGIVVTNIPAYGSESVAQHTFALLLQAANHIKEYDQFVKSGDWTKSGTVQFWNRPMVELSGKTLGVFGYGGIAKRVSEMAQAFSMKVLVATSHPDPAAESERLSFVSPDELLAQADIITLNRPLTEESHKMINREAIAKMKRGVILINTARGKLVDENALAEALHSGKIAYAALDVVDGEPIAPDNPLLVAKNCVITPHMAWTSNEARKRLANIALDNLESYLQGAPQNWVNP